MDLSEDWLSLKVLAPSKGALLQNTVGHNTIEYSTTFAIVCSQKNEVSSVEVKFNREVRDDEVDARDQEVIVAGDTVEIKVPRKFTREHVIGRGNNTHKIRVMSIPCDASFFNDIVDFRISAKGKIVILIEAKKELISLGTGIRIEKIKRGEIVKFAIEKAYVLPLAEADGRGEIKFGVEFEGEIVDFVVKVI